MALSAEEKLDILWSKDQIHDLLKNYCRACDRADGELLNSLFHADAKADYGFNKSGTAREFIDAMPGLRAGIPETQHNLTTHLIAVDGDNAEGEAYHVAYHRFDGEDGPTLMIAGGRYLDKFERRDGVWKISERRLANDWTVTVPAPADVPNDFTGDAVPHGLPGKDDASYKFFTMLR